MTTEQMDWLDDERAGRHAPRVILNPDEPAPDLDPEQHFGNEPDFYEQMERSRRDVAAFLRVPVEAIQITVNYDATEEHTHYTREARDQCAAGDHQYAKLLDEQAEREKIAAHDEAEGRPHLAEAIRELIDRPQGVTTMAEEPIENRLRRAWLNGFRDGVDRASYAQTESSGRWDY